MNLHRKLLLAQAPLAIALAVVAIVAAVTLSSLGRHSQVLLADNYRSVLAMQRTKEALERMDSGALFVIAGRREKGLEQAQANRARVEQEIASQEHNVTEPGEAELTRDLRVSWNDYQQIFDRLASSPTPEAIYFRDMEPSFLALKAQADRILDLNQDAMLRRSRSAREAAGETAGILVAVSIAASVAGVVASSLLTSRMLRPVRVLQQAAMRIGEGDLAARARIEGKDEIAALAKDFNSMAERLERYRQSSLGDLLQAQATAQSAIESLPDPVILFGNTGGILNVNHVAETWLGISLESDVSEPLLAASPPVREVLQRVCHHVLGGRGAYVPKGFEESVRVTTTEGDRWLLPRAAPVYGEGGEIVGAAAILQDVTRLRRFDELKNDLVATVAHEFRTPLTSLRMAIHLCVEEVAGPITPKQADLLYAAREDCERLQSIVDDLLDLARIQAGRLDLRRKPIDSEQLVEESVDEHRSSADDAGVKLRAEPDPMAGEVLADEERIGLVLSNLVTNAIRHSPREGVVRIASKADGDFVRFEVEDQGPGIAPEHQTEIFEKFFRVPGAPRGGAGLGLSISKEIVEAHGGTIGLESEVGRGSTFWFRVPTAGFKERA